MLLTFKLLFAACTYYVTIMIYEQKNENETKSYESTTKTRLGTEKETERRLPVSRNRENNFMRNALVNISWMEKS